MNFQIIQLIPQIIIRLIPELAIVTMSLGWFGLTLQSAIVATLMYFLSMWFATVFLAIIRSDRSVEGNHKKLIIDYILIAYPVLLSGVAYAIIADIAIKTETWNQAYISSNEGLITFLFFALIPVIRVFVVKDNKEVVSITTLQLLYVLTASVVFTVLSFTSFGIQKIILFGFILLILYRIVCEIFIHTHGLAVVSTLHRTAVNNVLVKVPAAFLVLFILFSFIKFLISVLP